MIIKTKYGSVKGYKRDGCNVFLGIPFATPPVGKLAFKHPIPPKPWAGVLEANKGSTNPIQPPGYFAIGNNSQDCLYLNIFVPENAKYPLPVMVWIYGGGYSQGGAGSDEPNSDKLMYNLGQYASETGCIVVSFNYRLNLYGFLNLSFLGDEFDVNNGLYDQIMALRFVKDNISEFGGNPNNITLFGQSAGGACTLALMSMKEAEGLFHKTIVQSACIDHFFSEKESKSYAKKFLKFAGVKKAKELFSLESEKIYRASKEYSSWIMKKRDTRCAFSPVIDGFELTAKPKDLVKNSSLPMLIGNVKDEGSMFIPAVSDTALAIGLKLVRMNVKKGKGSLRERASESIKYHNFIKPQLEILNTYLGPAWRYEYHHVLPESKMGCYHGCELAVLFGSYTKKVTDEDSLRVRGVMRSIWGKFAKDGNPGWTEYRNSGEIFLIK